MNVTRKSSYIISACLYGFLLHSGLGMECPYEECYCGEDTINCRGYGLDLIPPLVSNDTEGLTILVLDSNNITTIIANSLPANLTVISLAQSPITTIDIAAFDESVDTLEELIFEDARLTQIPEALLHLKTLKYLRIFNSLIVSWSDNVMKNIGGSLENLILRNAGTITSPTWLQYFSRLQHLTIDSGSLTSIPDNAFSLVTDNLTTIVLTNNSFTEIPKALYHLTALTDLALENNQIADVTWLPQSNLTYLSLSHNNISDALSLSKKLLQYYDSLNTLWLSENQLAVIPDFGFLTKLETLSLTNNKISDPESGNFPIQITNLDISSNNLTALPRAYSNLTILWDIILYVNDITKLNGSYFPKNSIRVRLERNLITELSDSNFPYNSSIEGLFLSFNPIQQISPNAFVNLPHLGYLEIQGTKLSRLPLSLVTLSSLSTLDARNNQGLVCSCDEKSLAPLFLAIDEQMVLGNCGQTSIYYFFKVLSPMCPS